MLNIRKSASNKSALKQVVAYCAEHPDEDIQIIVPDKLSLFMERYLFDEMGISCSFNIKVATLNRFVKRRNPVSPEMQISRTGSIILIHKILNELSADLKIMRNRAYSFSYAENIFDTIAQLKASKIGYIEMLDFVGKNQTLTDKIHDLALIYERYEQGKAGLLDMSDTFLSSAFFITEDLKDTTILIVGFDDFTAIEYSLIERMVVNARDVNVFVLSAVGKNKHIFNFEIYDQLRSIAYANDIGFNVVEGVVADGLTGYLEKNLFSIVPSGYTLTHNSVKLLSATSVDDEIESVARDIRRKINAGKQYSDFGVAVFNFDSHTKKIEEIFNKYDLNYYIDSKFTMDNSIYYKFVVSLLKYFLEGYETSHLIDIINSPFVDIDQREKRELIEYLMIYKYRGELRKLYVPETLTDVKTIVLSIIDKIKIDKNDTLHSFIDKLILFNQDNNVESVLNNIAENVADVRDKILLNKSVVNVYKILEEIGKFYPEAAIYDVYDIFIHVAKVVKINNLPMTVNAIKIIDADNVMEIFNDLYILGANSDNAPMVKADCGIILDGEIAELNFKHKLSPTIAFINRLNKLRLYNSVLMFSDNLTISYYKKPSIIIEELKNRLSVEINGVAHSLDVVDTRLLGHGILSEWDYIEEYCKNTKKYEKNLKNNIKNDDLLKKFTKNKEICNISKDKLSMYDDMFSVSASTLENYFKCPFNMFISNILKIRPRLDSQVKSLDVGNILHELIYTYYHANKNVGDVLTFCTEQIYKYVEANDRLKMSKDSPIIDNLIRESVRVIEGLNYIDDNSAFVPTYFEYEFKDKSFSERTALIGKIDRVDVCDDMLRVIDYKSGKADASLKELYYGNKLQLFMYSKAIERTRQKSVVGNFYLPLHNKYEKNDGENPYSLKGFFVNDKDVVQALDTRLLPGDKSDIVNLRVNKDGLAYKYGKALEESDYDMLKNYSYQVSKQALQEIKSGEIRPSPSLVSEPCKYCPYMQICMKNSTVVRERQAGKIVMESFKEKV